MEMKEVESSTITKIGYDADLMLLVAEFRNGMKYAYANVPADTYAALMSSPSVGKYFSANIREAYKYKKLNN